MKIFVIFILGSTLSSCGKTKLDSSTNAFSTQPTYACSQVSSCASTCGSNPVSSCMSGGGSDRSSCAMIDTSSYTSCMNKKVQIINGAIVTVGQ